MLTSYANDIIQVRTAVDGLRESATSKAKRFDQEMSTMKDSSSCIRNEWINYAKKAESHYLEDTAAVESGKLDLDEVLRNWYAYFILFSSFKTH